MLRRVDLIAWVQSPNSVGHVCRAGLRDHAATSDESRSKGRPHGDMERMCDPWDGRSWGGPSKHLTLAKQITNHFQSADLCSPTQTCRCRDTDVGIADGTAALKREAGVMRFAEGRFPNCSTTCSQSSGDRFRRSRISGADFNTEPRLPGFSCRPVQSSNCRYSGSDMHTQPRLDARRDGDFSRTFLRFGSCSIGASQLASPLSHRVQSADRSHLP